MVIEDLTLEDLKLISEALDSHLYWQVNEDLTRRNDGYVMPPYTAEEQEVVDLLERVDALIRAQA